LSKKLTLQPSLFSRYFKCWCIVFSRVLEILFAQFFAFKIWGFRIHTNGIITTV